MEDLIQLGLECGFTAAVPLDPKTLVLKQEVRDMCAVNKCGAYNSNWTCPPACGTLEEIGEKIAKYSRGVLLQTTGRMEDEYDIEVMMEAPKKHRESFKKFVEKLRELYPDAMPMGAGDCRNCQKCTYPDAPCRFPEKATVSMEGCGLVVTEVCQSAGIPYYYGRNTITYCACALY